MISPAALIAKFQQAIDEHWGYIWGTAGVLWTEARQQQKITYMVEKYGQNWKNSEAAKADNYYSAAANGSKWIGHKVADCSGLFYWAFKLLGGYIYHGSNTIWNKYCTAKGELKSGKRADGKELKAGSAVFTYNKKKDNRGHIGLYIGEGHVIEASGTINGVIISKITNSKWVEWGELKGVSYGSDTFEPAQKPTTEPAQTTEKEYHTLRKGSKGDAVKELQTLLNAHGFNCGAVDGIFGKNTLAAVREFQKANGLALDGVVGPKTWAALNGAKPVKYTATIPQLTAAQAEALKQQFPGVVITEERGE